MAIVAPSSWHCPWAATLQGIQLQGLRLALIAALRPKLRTGPRAQSAVIANCLKFHAVDPFLAPCYNLAVLLVPHWRALRSLIQQAMTEQTQPLGPITTFAHMMRLLDVGLTARGLVLKNSEQLIMDQTPSPRWKHSLRSFLRAAELIKGTAHRREFEEIQTLPMDWSGSLHWHHALSPGPSRQALEWALTGGMLTPARVKKKSKEGATANCKVCSEEVDDDVHRIMHCARWQVSRHLMPPEKLPPYTCTYLLGLFPAGHECTQQQIHLWQAHLATVANATQYDPTENHVLCHHAKEVADSEPKLHDRVMKDAENTLIRRRIYGKRRLCDALPLLHPWIKRYREGSHSRVSCSRCLRTASITYETEFLRKHKRCGHAVKPAITCSLPPHVQMQKRAIAGSDLQRFVLSCSCGGIGSTGNVRRFLMTHMKCNKGSTPRLGRPGRLSRGEKRAVSKAGFAQALSLASKAKVARLLLVQE